MAVYRDCIYPQLIRILGNPKPIRDIRQRVIPLAQGTVLEIGVGSGVNFVYYDPALAALIAEAAMVAATRTRR